MVGTRRVGKIRLGRKRDGETVKTMRNGIMPEGKRLASMAVRWVRDQVEGLVTADPEMPDGIYSREADNWRPLFAAADVGGGHWPGTARRAALALSDNIDSEQSIGVQLLGDIHDVFADSNGIDRLSSEDLCNKLNEQQEWRWCTHNRGQPMTQHQLARVLKPYKIRPPKTNPTIRIGERTARGYMLEWFTEAFALYLSKNPQRAQQAQHGPASAAS